MQHFYYEFQIKVSIISNTNLPPLLSTGGTQNLRELSGLTGISTQQQGRHWFYTALTMGDVCILSCCYYLELSVYEACGLQIYLKHQLHSMPYKRDCGCKSCLMIWDWCFSEHTSNARQGSKSIGQSVSTRLQAVLQCARSDCTHLCGTLEK